MSIKQMIIEALKRDSESIDEEKKTRLQTAEEALERAELELKAAKKQGNDGKVTQAMNNVARARKAVLAAQKEDGGQMTEVRVNEEVKIPPELKKTLGSWAKTVNHFSHYDKGFQVGFSDKVSKKEFSQKIGVKEYMVDEVGPSKFFVDDQE